MYINEEKAKELWCPMTHTMITVLLDPNGIAAEQQIKQGEALVRKANCLGKKCACWQISVDDSSHGKCGLTK